MDLNIQVIDTKDTQNIQPSIVESPVQTVDANGPPASQTEAGALDSVQTSFIQIQDTSQILAQSFYGTMPIMIEDEPQITEEERQAEYERLLEARKSSKIQQQLEQLRKQQIVLQMYNDQIKQASEINVYRRKTFLDAPEDPGLPEVTVVTDSDPNGNTASDTKLSKEEQIDDYEIKVQFVAGAEQEQEQRKQLLEMSIKADIHRLCQMYLNALTKLKLSLPSENVECRSFEKIVNQLREKSSTTPGSFSNTNSIQIPNDLKQSQRVLSTRQTGSLSQKGEFNNNQSFASSKNDFEQSRAGSITSMNSQSSFQVQELNQSRIISSSSPFDPTLQIIVKQQCMPRLVRMDLELPDDKNIEVKQLWQNLITELQTNSTVCADLVDLIIQEGLSPQFDFSDEASRQEQRNRTLLVNMSQFFWDNIHTEERLAFHENNNFLRFFVNFAHKYMPKSKFGKDEIGNVVIQDIQLKQAIQCLFEGLTRKIPAFNYLKFVYAGPFNRINLFQIDSDLQRIGLKAQELSASIAQNNRNNMKVQQNNQPAVDQKKSAAVEKGWWQRMKEKFKGKDEQKNNQGDMDGMIFDDKTEEERQSIRSAFSNRNSNLKNVKLYEAMVQVYGGDSNPFPNLGKSDEAYQLKRFEQIEQKIAELQYNNHKFLMNEFQEFKPKPSQRIKMNETAVKELCVQKVKNPKAIDSEGVYGEKQEKNLTYYIKTLVQKNFEQMLNFSQKIPFAIRAMLKIIIIRSRGQEDFNSRLKLDADEIHMLAEILIAGWLNTGYRNPKCFGIQPTVEKELELEYIFFQASRIVFEHTMLMQEIPEDICVEGFDIIDLNRFIKTMSSHVFVFWIRLVNIDISEINQTTKPSMINSSMMRIDDLDMIFLYCQKLQESKQPQENQNQVRDKEKWEQFDNIMNQLGQKVQAEDLIMFNDVMPLIPIDTNNIGMTIQRHLGSLLSLPNDGQLNRGDKQLNEEVLKYEYYLLFLKKKTPKEIQDDLKAWHESCQSEIRQMNTDFVTQNFKINEAPPQVNQSADAADIEIRKIFRQNSMYQKSAVNQADYSQVQQILQPKNSHLSQQVLMTRKLSSGVTQNLSQSSSNKVVKMHKLAQGHIPLNQIENVLMNIFNSLRVLLDNSQLLFDCLRDQKNKEEIKDLIDLFISADKANKIQPKPNIQISVGCMHIIRMLKSLNLEGHFDIQNSILKQFVNLMEQKVKRSRVFLDQMIINTETLAVDVERFESNITNLKQFHTKFENNLKFMRTISRYNPEVCFLECFKFDLNDEWRQFKGLLLNLSCSQHQTNLPMSSYMLFGVVSRKAQGVINQQINPVEEEKIVSEEDLEIRKVRDKRIARFREHYYVHTNFTVSLQNCQEGTRPRDEQIKLIEAMIQYYISKNKGQPYLKALIRADEEKYRQLALLNSNELKHLETEQEKFEYLSMQEPYDYMNMVRTYTMFLQHISVLSSNSAKDQYIDEKNDNNFQIKQHYDFLQCDLTAKALRYQVHDYIMKRIHRTIFGTTKHFETDKKVQELILAKQEDPNWVLTSQKSRQDKEKGIKPADFTDTPEWCDPYIYSASLKTLLRVADEETPHIKAIYIDDAVTQAINAMKIATPYKKSDAIGEPERQRVMRHLILELCKIYEKAHTNPRLYSQLLYILLFNLPQNEIVMYGLIKQQNQKWLSDKTIEKNYSKLPQFEQHQLMLGKIGDRNKVYEWFGILQGLLHEDRQKRKSQQQVTSTGITPAGVQTPQAPQTPSSGNARPTTNFNQQPTDAKPKGK